MEPTRDELEAAALLWRNEHPELGEEAVPPDAEIDLLVRRVRANMRAVEAQAMHMLKRATRIRWSKAGASGGYGAFFLMWVLTPLVVIALILGFIGWLVGPR